MISLYPDSGPVNPLVDVASEDRPSRMSRPWIFSNMVASIDGATAIDNVSGGLGRPADSEQFVALRAAADAILVGSATVQAERYRPPQLNQAAIASRRARSQPDLPQIVVVTSNLSFDLDLPLFTDADYRPLVATTESAPADKLLKLRKLADIVIAGEESVDFESLAATLFERGIETLLVEGGPRINNQLVELDLVDEWNLSISPFLVGGTSRRAAQGPTTLTAPPEMKLDRLWRGDEMLFGRWLRA